MDTKSNTSTPSVDPAELSLASEALNLIFSNSNGKYEGLFKHIHAVTDNVEEFKGLLALLGTGLITEAQLSTALTKFKEPSVQSLMIKTWVNAIKPPTKDSCIKIMNDFAEKDTALVADVILNRREYFPQSDIAKFIVDNAGKGITMKLVSLLSKEMEKLKDREV